MYLYQKLFPHKKIIRELLKELVTSHINLNSPSCHHKSIVLKLLCYDRSFATL